MKLLVLLFILTEIALIDCKKYFDGYKHLSLPKFNVDINETSVSGFSSGAFLAHQVQVAFSSFIKGAGIIATGPYDCIGTRPSEQCTLLSVPPIKQLIGLTNQWSGSLIDSTSYMRRQKVYMISGVYDIIISQNVMNQVYNYLVTDGQYLEAENVIYKTDLQSTHTFPTDFDADGNNKCAILSLPFISNCAFDAAGAFLNHIYGPLKPRREPYLDKTTGHYITFSQSEFISDPHLYGLAEKGFAFIPNACFNGHECRLHVAIHGCLMSYEIIGDKWVRNSGYDLWADTNNIIVVYPQTTVDKRFHLTQTQTQSILSFIFNPLLNTLACWDFVGWYSPAFATKYGIQMLFIKRIVERIAR